MPSRRSARLNENITEFEVAASKVKSILLNNAERAVAPYAAQSTRLRSRQAVLLEGKSALTGLANFGLSFTARDIVVEAFENGDGELRAKMEILLANWQRRMNRKVGLQNAMEGVARRAKNQTLLAYKELVPESNYRQGENRLVHAMELALKNSDWVTATPDGILFGNVAVLDAAAANWHRLNFGAGSRGSTGRSQKFRVFFGLNRESGEKGRVVISNFGLTDGPSPSFGLPEGVFLGRGTLSPVQFDASRRGKDAFFTRSQYLSAVAEHAFGEGEDPLAARKRAVGYHFNTTFGLAPLGGTNSIRDISRPGTKNRNRPGLPSSYARESRGIRGYHFLDAGVNVIRIEMPREYSKIFAGWFEEATREVPRGPLA